MSNKAAYCDFTEAITTIENYDPAKINCGEFIRKLYDSKNNQYMAPPTGMARMGEEIAQCAAFDMIEIDDDTDYIIISEYSSGASTTRRIVLYEFHKSTFEFRLRGSVILNFNNNVTYNVRGIRAIRDLYTGVAYCSGTDVTVDTTLISNGVATGARIGFGSTDPNEITQWYDITNISSEFTATIDSSAGTMDEVPFVIDELRLVIGASTSTNTSYGGIYIAKGLHFGLFNLSSINIQAGTTTDNIRATYYLQDNATPTVITLSGMDVDERINATTQYVYGILGSGSNTPQICVFNIRAPLTGLSAGKSLSAFVCKTGTCTTQGSTPGVMTCRILTLDHGPYAGKKFLYFTTANRLYRCELEYIYNNSVNWLFDGWTENTPLGANKYPLPAYYYSPCFAPSINKMILATTYKTYIFDYQTSVNKGECAFGSDTRLADGALAENLSYKFLSNCSTYFFVLCSSKGIMYLVRNTSTLNTNQIYAYPLHAHYLYAKDKKQQLITPALKTPKAVKYLRLYINEAKAPNLDEITPCTDGYKVYARTSGIEDNSGGWIQLKQNGDLSAFKACDQIQFMFEYRLLGPITLPSRLYSISVSYEAAEGLPSEFIWDIENFDSNNGIFAFKQRKSISNLNKITIYYYAKSNNQLLFKQSSDTTQYGVFEYWNGGSWQAGLGSNASDNIIRFRPTCGLPAGASIYAAVTIN